MYNRGELIEIAHKNWKPVYEKSMTEIVKLSETLEHNGNIILDLQN